MNRTRRRVAVVHIKKGAANFKILAAPQIFQPLATDWANGVGNQALLERLVIKSAMLTRIAVLTEQTLMP
jgi:hypothetical protein